MRVKHYQVYGERFDLIPGTALKTFVIAKGRPEGVLEIVFIAIHSSGDDQIKDVQRVFIVRGVESYLDTQDDLTKGKVKAWSDPLYLANGHELALRFKGEKVDSPCRIFIHYLWHPDKER